MGWIALIILIIVVLVYGYYSHIRVHYMDSYITRLEKWYHEVEKDFEEQTKSDEKEGRNVKAAETEEGFEKRMQGTRRLYDEFQEIREDFYKILERYNDKDIKFKAGVADNWFTYIDYVASYIRLGKYPLLDESDYKTMDMKQLKMIAVVEKFESLLKLS